MTALLRPDETLTLGHRLTHVTMQSPQGPRLTPACTCGWWSADGSHTAFERHIRKVAS